MGTIPEALWGSVSQPEMTSQTGCVYCLIEGVHAPVDIVYYWGGTSLCFQHLPPHAKAYPPLTAPQPQGPNA